MAVKGVCSIVSIGRDPDDHSHFVATCTYAALTDASVSGNHAVGDLDPTGSAATITLQIEAAMKTYLEGEGITFGLLDSVRLLPAL